MSETRTLSEPKERGAAARWLAMLWDKGTAATLRHYLAS